VDLGQKTDSELHVIHVAEVPSLTVLYPEATDPEGVEVPDPILEEDLEQFSEFVSGGRITPCETRRVNFDQCDEPSCSRQQDLPPLWLA
jgi:hypothetical protein